MITAKVIADSISPEGIRLTTLQLRYPRMVHADFMTHRVFSRNGRSSRAVPFSVLVKEEPYVPHFMKNQPGMVASQELSLDELTLANEIWLKAAYHCQDAAKALADIGVHKQWVNRMLEWFGYIDVLVTSTDWANFFELRLDGGAQPEIIQLAQAMHDAMEESTPSYCVPSAWHLPYVDYVLDAVEVTKYIEADWEATTGEHRDHMPIEGEELGNVIYDYLKKISVARCARLTIKPFDGDASIEKELSRYNLLMVSRPVHASPAEHIATPDTKLAKDDWAAFGGAVWSNPRDHGNFRGWRQFRKMIPYNTIYDK